MTISTSTQRLSGAVLTWDVKGPNRLWHARFDGQPRRGRPTNSLGLTCGSGVGTSGTPPPRLGRQRLGEHLRRRHYRQRIRYIWRDDLNRIHRLALRDWDMNYRRSSTGPANGYWQYQINGGALSSSEILPASSRAPQFGGGNHADLT